MNEIQQLIADLQALSENSEPQESEKAQKRLNELVISDPESAKEIVQQLEMDALLQAHFQPFTSVAEPAEPKENKHDANSPGSGSKGEKVNLPEEKPNKTITSARLNLILGTAASLFFGVGLFWLIQSFQEPNTQLSRSTASEFDGEKASNGIDAMDSKEMKTDSVSKNKEPSAQSKDPWTIELIQGDRKTLQTDFLNLEYGRAVIKGNGSRMVVETPIGSVQTNGAAFEVSMLPNNVTDNTKVTGITVSVTTGQVTLSNNLGTVVVVANQSATASKTEKPNLIQIP